MSTLKISFGNLTGAAIASELPRNEKCVMLSVISWTRLSFGRCVRTLEEIGKRACYGESTTRRALEALRDRGLIDFTHNGKRWIIKIAFRRILSLRPESTDQSSDSEGRDEAAKLSRLDLSEWARSVKNTGHSVKITECSVKFTENCLYNPRAEDSIRQVKDREERERADASARASAPRERLERERELNAERVEVELEAGQAQADLGGSTPRLSPHPKPSTISSSTPPRPSNSSGGSLSVREFARPALQLWREAKNARLSPFETREIQELVAEYGLERVKSAMRETARAAYSRPRLDWVIDRLRRVVERGQGRETRDLTPSRSHKINSRVSPRVTSPTSPTSPAMSPSRAPIPTTIKIAPHPGLAALGLSPTFGS